MIHARAMARVVPIPVRHVSDEERRARLGLRNGLVPAARARSVSGVLDLLGALHATEPATVHLAVGARAEGVEVDDVEQALWTDRSVVKQHAMRRTLFGFDPALLPAVWGSAAARTARADERDTVRAAGRTDRIADPVAWLDQVCAEVLAVLAGGEHLSPAQVVEAVPALQVRLPTGAGKWQAEVPAERKVLGLLGARGLLVRSGNRSHWRGTARPTWSATAAVLPDVGEPWDEARGYAALVAGWLRTFGPGTEDDVVWWLGATKTAVRRALAGVGAVPVSLDSGSFGWLLPDDVEPVPTSQAEPWAALLPVLDPTAMGWKERSFHLDPADAPFLYDSVGNAGTTAWWNGRMVGCWVQDDAGRVTVVPRRELPRDAHRSLAAEAERLTDWLAGVRIPSVYATRQMRSARLP